MKTALSFFIFLMIVYGFTSESYAQSTGVASVFATIVTSTTIEKTDSQDLNSGSSKSTAAAIFSREDTRQSRNNIISIQQPGAITLAEFTIKGEDLSSFAITLPVSPVYLIHSASVESIQVNSFISTSGTIGALSNGSHTLLVSANIDYKPGQHSGIYHSPPVHVIVNYN